MKEETLIYKKSFLFAKRIIKLTKYLNTNKNEYVISNQILKSGTSIGANIAESKYAQSEKDFLNKLYVALKEANETKYWLELLKDEYLTEKEAKSLIDDNIEILKILISTTKKLKEKIR